MQQDKHWFYLSAAMSTLFAGYMLGDLYIKKKQTNSLSRSSIIKVNDTPKMSAGDFEQKNTISKNKKVIKIVFTGGPCAGKTTSMASCADLLRDRGFRVYLVPEAATQIAVGGGMIQNANYTTKQAIIFQQYLMRMQMNLEDRFTEIANIAKCEQPAVLLCDRGTMDGMAYIDERSWQVLLDEMGYNAVQLRDNRYDAVIHLVTAADGAEDYYNQQNAARYESSLQQARDVDLKLQQAWHGHPYWIKIDNSFDFSEKIKRAQEALLHLVGQTTSLTFYKKFLLTDQNQTNLQIFQVEDTFIKHADDFVERRIRRRVILIKKGQNDSFVYLLFETRVQNDKQIETKRRIRSRDYLALYENRDPDRQTVKKTKKTFIWHNIAYSVENFEILNQSFVQCILQTEEKRNEKLAIPDFLREKIVREITGIIIKSDDPNYIPLSIAVKTWTIPVQDQIAMKKMKKIK